LQPTNTNSLSTYCFCGSNISFDACCQPYIIGLKTCQDAEILMRSRYSAYATKQFSYIIETYAKAQRKNLQLLEFQQSGEGSQWLKLEILGFIEQKNTAQVEFNAFYRIDGAPEKEFYKLHELSDFRLEDGQWRYTTGEIFDDSGVYVQQRNESCLCASGKKFKKCCGF
jgi:SEC-C motif-containing protein